MLAEFAWKSRAKEGNSPVSENIFVLFIVILKYDGERRPRWKPAGLVCQD